MPTLRVEMFEGRPVELKRKLIQEVTRTTCEVLGCPAGAVEIIITEVKRENWASAGELWLDKP